MAIIGVRTTPIANWNLGAANPNVFMLSGGDWSPDGFVYTSPSGLEGTWVQAGEIGYPGTKDACGWGTNFVIVGTGGVGYAASTYSDDNGATWQSGDLAADGTGWEGVACKPDGSIVVAVGNSILSVGSFSRSLDGGATWSALASLPGQAAEEDYANPAKIAWNGNVFCVICFNAAVFTSPDGATWTRQAEVSAYHEMYDIIGRLSDGLLVVVGVTDDTREGAEPGSSQGGIWVSADDGDSWTAAPFVLSGDINRIAGTADTFLVTGEEPSGRHYSTSVDGLIWATPIMVPDGGEWEFFGLDAEASRDDACLLSGQFTDYVLLMTGGVTPPAASPLCAFFHFLFP